MTSTFRQGLAALLVLAFPLAACAEEPATGAAPPPAPAAEAPQEALLVTDLVKGVGNEALPGLVVVVHYTGWLHDPAAPEQRGKKFDSSRDRNEPFSFPLGAGHVIKGWEQGVPGMKVGGLRRLVIPPSLGYGPRNVGNGLIPPNSTLLFEVELLGLESVTLTPQAQ